MIRTAAKCIVILLAIALAYACAGAFAGATLGNPFAKPRYVADAPDVFMRECFGCHLIGGDEKFRTRPGWIVAAPDLWAESYRRDLEARVTISDARADEWIGYRGAATREAARRERQASTLETAIGVATRSGLSRCEDGTRPKWTGQESTCKTVETMASVALSADERATIETWLVCRHYPASRAVQCRK